MKKVSRNKLIVGQEYFFDKNTGTKGLLLSTNGELSFKLIGKNNGGYVVRKDGTVHFSNRAYFNNCYFYSI